MTIAEFSPLNAFVAPVVWAMQVSASGYTSALKLLPAELAATAEATDWQVWGRAIDRYRRYVDGDHDFQLTREQRKALNLPADGGFVDNYADVITRTMASRLIVTAISGGNAEVEAWVGEALAANRFDALQMAVHEQCLIDGDTFVMVGFDNDTGQVKITHEMAFNGRYGIIPIYRGEYSNEMVAALKQWDETRLVNGRIVTVQRYNVYYPDRIERYGKILGIDDQIRAWHGTADAPTDPISAWLGRDGQPLGIPVIHFRNRGRGNMGISELASAITLQDALNNILHDILITSRLTGFQMRAAIGFDPPATVSPGDWIVIGKEGLDTNQQVDVKTLPNGEIGSLIDAARFIVREIANTTSTAAPELFQSDDLSGEAFKAREASLISKVEAAQITLGNAWEDVALLAQRVASAFGTINPPQANRYYTQWRPATKRDVGQEIDNLLKLKDVISREDLLIEAGKIMDWGADRVADMAAKLTAEAANLSVPMFTSMNTDMGQGGTE